VMAALATARALTIKAPRATHCARVSKLPRMTLYPTHVDGARMTLSGEDTEKGPGDDRRAGNVALGAVKGVPDRGRGEEDKGDDDADARADAGVVVQGVAAKGYQNSARNACIGCPDAPPKPEMMTRTTVYACHRLYGVCTKTLRAVRRRRHAANHQRTPGQSTWEACFAATSRRC
jgi:hypothetical protein